jgi:GT2 family glycosyltransferase/peptidoglycan/xylan/chitin deacetylase (PgdA/CDA1 family)
VLLYHSISDATGTDSFAISPHKFAAHLDLIEASGRTAVTISELARGLRSPGRLPENAVAITFDDGFADTLSAVRQLRARDLRATVYVQTGAIGSAGRLDRAQLETLAQWDASLELGAHTISHPRLDELSSDRARAEIRGSKLALEDLIGRPVDSFAYPHGAYDERVRHLVIESGFLSAAAVKNALSHELDDAWAIARWSVRADTTVDEVESFLGGGGAPLAWRRERARTKAYRQVRRLRRAVAGSPGTPRLATATGTVGPADAPVAVRCFDLDEELGGASVGAAEGGAPYRALAAFLRQGADPVGWVTLPLPASGHVDPALLRLAQLEQLGPLTDAPVAEPDQATRRRAAEMLVSVVIPTCADADRASSCVTRILEHPRGPVDVIVVENRPAQSNVRAALEDRFGSDGPVRYIEAPVPGLSRARNSGLKSARGELVAFVDDDVLVDSRWLGSIRLAAAANEDVACLTGLILPLALDTPAQLLLEQFATFGKGFRQQRYDLASRPANVPLFPYTAGHFGSGANMVFRRDALIELGGFDPALGTGTPARGGEDLDICIRLILSGRSLLYEPRAIVWHRHPATMREVGRQAFSYGVGLGAMITKQLVRGPDRAGVLRRVPAGALYLLDGHSRKNAGKGADFPRRLTALERLGLLVGPAAYLESRRQSRSIATGASSPDLPQTVWSGELELTAPSFAPRVLVSDEGGPFTHARVLARVQQEPVGFVQLALVDGRLDWYEVMRAVEDQLGAIKPVPDEAPWVDVSEDRLVSVVVCTRNRADGLRRCLDSLRRLRYPNLEFLIVDNAPDDDSSERCVAELAAADERIRYVRENRPGLSTARNRGLALARGEFVAFTDDDVRVDSLWVDGIVRGFARRADVGCVTGLVASASLRTQAEQYFDGRVWWSSSCEQRLHDITRAPSDSRLHPFAAGSFGTGANMSFRAQDLRRIGGFDEALGAGSPTGGGEDLDVFVRLLRGGSAISYEPASLVWHENRPTEHDLEQQMYAYGKGLAAYLFKYLTSSSTSLNLLVRLNDGVRHVGVLHARSSSAGERAQLPRRLWWAEVRGFAVGPFAYHRARRRQDHEARRAVTP